MASNSKQERPVTKKEKREIAREKARILREQEEKRKRRNKTLAVVGGLIALVLIVFAILQILNSDDTGKEFDGTARPAQLANVTEDYGIDIDANGAAGTPVADAGILSIYSDYTCSGCIRLEDTYSDTYRQHMQGGDMGLRLYPVATLGNQVSDNAAAAMFYVATYAPEQALAFNEALFTKTNDVVFNGGAAPDEEAIAEIAASVGVPEDVVADLPASIASDDWKEVTDKATESFRGKNYQYTPTLEVNGELDESWTGEGGSVEAVIQRTIDAGAPTN